MPFFGFWVSGFIRVSGFGFLVLPSASPRNMSRAFVAKSTGLLRRMAIDYDDVRKFIFVGALKIFRRGGL